MPRLLNLIAIPCLFILTLLSFAFADDSVTITTYYPAPYGVYKEFETYSNTYLAHTSGNVGIGTSSPRGKLELNGSLFVSNSAGTSGQVLQSQGAGAAPVWGSVTSALQCTTVSATRGYQHVTQCNQTVQCPAGYSVTGGGWYSTVFGESFIYSWPTGNGWNVWISGMQQPSDCTVYAVCCK